MLAEIKLKRGTAAQWAAQNPVLAEGQEGYDTTLKMVKIGDGVTGWSALRYAFAVGSITTVSPFSYSGVGDDTADDTTSVQSALTAGASFGFPVDLGGYTWKTTDTLTMPAGAQLQNGSIRCTATAKKIIHITGSDVALRRVSVIGRHATVTAHTNETGIHATGASAAAPLTAITIDDCSVELVGKNGILLEHVNGFRVKGCDIGDVAYAGIGTLSALNGVIEGNRVDNIPGNVGYFGTIDCYGVHLSNVDEVADLAVSPRSANVTVTGNVFSNIGWEGIDTHGGERLTITGNIVYGCHRGIVMASADAEGDVPTFAPLNFSIKGNVIVSTKTDGTSAAGIVVSGAQGASSSAPATQYATGVISGNTIRNHGPENDSTTGAIFLRNTMGLSVIGNTIEQPGALGVCLYYDNKGITVTNNTVADVWSNTSAITAAVGVRSENNTGLIEGNTLVNAGQRAGATHLNKYGIYCGGVTGSDIRIGVNHFTIASVATLSHTVAGIDSYGRLISVGSAAAPGLAFAGDGDSGLFWVAADSIAVSLGGVQRIRWTTAAQIMSDGINFSLGTTTGSMLGTGSTQKLGFWGATPAARPTGTPAAATDAATTQALVNDIRSKLITMGLIA